MIDEVRGDSAGAERIVPGLHDWGALLAGRRTAELAERAAQFDDPINIQYTCGTTGFPKGATLSHHNILNNGFFVGERCGYAEHDRVCIPVPFYHCFGMVLGNLACTTHGACIVVPAPAFDPGPRWRPSRPSAARPLRRADHVHRRARPPALRRVRPLVPANRHHGRLALPGRGDAAGSRGDAHARGHDLLRHDRDLAGLHPDGGGRPAREAGGDGRPRPSARRGQDRRPGHGADRAAGEPGELCTRGYCVMLGYWNDPEATAEAIDAARWMHTGDLATMDEDGYVNIVGRIKDLIIRGGENVYPREIEEFLYGHPAVADVQVVGVPDARYGEELMAWVVPRGGAAPTRSSRRSAAAGSPTTRSRATYAAWTSSR